MKRALAALIAASLLLSGCSNTEDSASDTGVSDRIDGLEEIRDRLAGTDKECSDWVVNEYSSGAIGNCTLYSDGHVTVQLSDTPQTLGSSLRESLDPNGVVVGENWTLACFTADEGTCGHIADLVGGWLLPEKDY